METNKKVVDKILAIIPDSYNIEFHYGNWVSFESKGSDKRTKKCMCKYDNNGIVSILKQIDVFKGMRYLTNGQPSFNCKTIFTR